MTDELENAYQTLGLEAGPATTDAEIKKVNGIESYGTVALQYLEAARIF